MKDSKTMTTAESTPETTASESETVELSKPIFSISTKKKSAGQLMFDFG